MTPRYGVHCKTLTRSFLSPRLPCALTESLSGGHAEGHRDALQHGDRVSQQHPAGPGGRAHTAAQQHPAADAGVRGPAQHEDEAGGRDRHIQTAAGRRRLHVSKLMIL